MIESIRGTPPIKFRAKIRFFCDKINLPYAIPLLPGKECFFNNKSSLRPVACAVTQFTH